MEDVYSEPAQGWGFQKRELGAGDVFSTCHFDFLCLIDGSWPLRGSTVMLAMCFVAVAGRREQTHAVGPAPWTPPWLRCPVTAMGWVVWKPLTHH